jgi:hypothetical protein
MKTIDKTDKAIGLLKWHYYGNIVMLAVVFLPVLSRVIPFFTDEQVSVSVTMERYAIMISIIAIPVSLKFFAHRLKKLPRPLETATAVKKYVNASFLRLYAISGVTLMHIVLFGISRNMNFFWFTVVLFIVFLFCKPSYAEMKILTEAPEEGKPEEEQPPLPNECQPCGELSPPGEEEEK